MDFTIDGRATGKTTRVLQMMAADPEMVVIVHSEQYAHHFKTMFKERYGDIAIEGRVITIYDAVGERSRGKHQRPAVIDNLDLVLDHLFGRHFNVEHVTSTGIVQPLGERT